MLVTFSALLVAVASMLITLIAVNRVRQLERQLAEAKRPLPQTSVETLETPSSLVGLRIALDVTQDHPHPLFANLLKEQLLRQDVADVTFDLNSEADIFITGAITCNGYAEVYYQAEFTCSTLTEPICTLSERPPGGDRPANLAIELVAKLNAQLTTLITRQERRRAIRELGTDL
jgi:hypothetical protein